VKRLAYSKDVTKKHRFAHSYRSDRHT